MSKKLNWLYASFLEANKAVEQWPAWKRELELAVWDANAIASTGSFIDSFAHHVRDLAEKERTK